MENVRRVIKKNKTIIVAGSLVLLVVLMFTSMSNNMSIGYLSGAQGLEPQFNSVRWKDAWWSSTEKGSPVYLSVSPSLRSFGYSMQLDPDGSQEGMPDLCASTQTMTRDADPPTVYEWMVNTGQAITLSNGTIVQKATQFSMYKYRMDWALNLWSTGSEKEADGKYFVSDWLGGSWPNIDGGAYSSAEVWIKLKPQSFVYFTDNPDQVFFAPTYIALSEPCIWSGTDQNGQITTNDGSIASINDIIPESSGEALGIYYQRGGGEAPSTTELLNYQGVSLDPAIFRDEYWARINLVELQAYSWTSWGIFHSWKYPSAYLHFTVDMFVVGTWTVYYQTGQVPPLTPHQPNGTYDFLSALWANLTSLFGLSWIILAVAVMVAAVIIIKKWK